MKGISLATRKLMIGVMAIVQLLFFPVVTFAETPSPASSTNSSATSETANGPQKPTGADAKTYAYNEKTGLWENSYYTWDPATKQTSPKSTPAYSYNPATNKWDTTTYVYEPASGAYAPLVSSTAEKPAGTTSEPTSDSTALSVAPASATTTLPEANTKHGAFSSFYNASISNNISTSAHSGDSAVGNNTRGANATSGDALAIANVLTILQSSWGMSPEQLTTFMADINGDVVGDLLLDPDSLGIDDLPVGNAHPSDLTVSTSTNSSINNNIDVVATTGDTSIIGNTTGGNAMSGTATAIANVINLINAHITAGQSFVGNININGNLEGDILLPENLQNDLLASNVPTTTLPTTSFENGELLAEFNGKHAITSNTNLTAQSGYADVSKNTTGGNAKSGNADTNLTVFNLTGRQVIGNNALLVFVNVLGEWVGMIVNAPAESTTAMIGNNTSAALLPQDVNLSEATSHTITNNISVISKSGNAAVQNNTTGGNAQSGGAQAAANIADISNSQLSLADWFGIIFINVLGSWHGSFGIDTIMGGSKTTPPTAMPESLPQVSDIRVFTMAQTTDSRLKVVPASTNKRAESALTAIRQSRDNSQADHQAQALGSTDSPGTPKGTASVGSDNSVMQWWPAVLALLLALLLISGDRVLRNRARSLQPRRNTRFTTVQPTSL